MSEDVYSAVWPRGEKAVEVTNLAPRLETLEGRTVAFLWDDLFRGDEIFPILQRELSAAHPGMHFVGYDTFGSTHGPLEEQILADLPATLAGLKVDAVVSGVGC